MKHSIAFYGNKKEHMQKRGFTLVELLVVIAIISILTSVVLASLRTAREKGIDAAVQAEVKHAGAEAELFGNKPDGTVDYTGLCGTAVGDPLAAIMTSITTKTATPYCNSSDEQWVFAAPLIQSSYICRDSSGFSETVASGTQPTTGLLCS